jgi:hypothetical protein
MPIAPDTFQTTINRFATRMGGMILSQTFQYQGLMMAPHNLAGNFCMAEEVEWLDNIWSMQTSKSVFIVSFPAEWQQVAASRNLLRVTIHNTNGPTLYAVVR